MKVKNDHRSFFFRCLLSNCLSWNINCDDQGCHGQGKVREKQKFFKVGEKSENFVFTSCEVYEDIFIEKIKL